MSYRTTALIMAMAAGIALTGCAASPEEQQRKIEMEADIDEILSFELDEREFGEVEYCLRASQYERIRPLGDRHLLFEGRKGKQWVNVLRGRCPSYGGKDIYVMHLANAGRVCDKDRFNVADPMSVGTSGRTCALGMFKPVAQSQVQEIEKRLEME